jgi:hypothetical protein
VFVCKQTNVNKTLFSFDDQDFFSKIIFFTTFWPHNFFYYNLNSKQTNQQHHSIIDILLKTNPATQNKFVND